MADLMEAKIDIKEVDRFLKGFQKDLSDMVGARAGFYEGDKERDSGELISTVALRNEFGTGKIPPRPFMRNTISKGKRKWGLVLQRLLAKENLTGKQVVMQLALQMQRDLVESIDSNTPPPNSPVTIERKKSSRTLIDTGTMRGSVHSAPILKGDK